MKKACTIFLILTVCLGFAASAAEPFHFKPIYNYETKNLEKQLKNTKTDTAKLNLLISLAFDNNDLVESPAYIDTGYLNQLIQINEQAKLFDDKPFRTLRLALREGTPNNYAAELPLLKTAIGQFAEQNIDIPMVLIGARWIFNVANKQEEKNKFYTEQLTYYLQKGQYNNAAACYHCLAGYYIIKSDYNSAINNYLKAGELFRSFSHLWYMHEFLIVSDTYNDWGNPVRSRVYLQKALKEKNSSLSGNDRFGVMLAVATMEYDLKHYQKSLSYITDAGRQQIFVSNTNVIALKALNLIGLNRLNEAWTELSKVKAAAAENSLIRAIQNGGYSPDYAFYKYYLATNNIKQAENSLLDAYKTANGDGDLQLEVGYLKELSQFYGDRNKSDEAWHYTVLYHRLNDSLQSRTNAFNIASYENEQKENEQNKKLILLQQQRAVQEAVISQRNIIIWISLVGLALVAVSLVFIYRQLRINKHNLNNLKATQKQLIQSEKMASLGELTAGIAHEIQNPLNFVNNFSEVSIELLSELKTEEENGNKAEVIAIADDLTQNLEKINHHGKRADAIVKGMLQHSQTGSGAKELLNVNVLADEYMRLAYHGLRAKDKSFNAELITHYDEHLPKINAIPQDMGRVLLNLFNNAFYAVNQKQKVAGADYKPEVSVTTLTKNGSIIIKVKDNGNGIPDAIKDKIMQPFFTTKPTGEGTGLGLSLSYDIIVKGHAGIINVDTKEGEFTEFTVSLPISSV